MELWRPGAASAVKCNGVHRTEVLYGIAFPHRGLLFPSLRLYSRRVSLRSRCVPQVVRCVFAAVECKLTAHSQAVRDRLSTGFRALTTGTIASGARVHCLSEHASRG